MKEIGLVYSQYCCSIDVQSLRKQTNIRETIATMLEKMRSYAKHLKRMSENWISLEEAERQTKFRYAKAKEDAKAGITKDSAYYSKLLADSRKKASHKN